MPMLKYEQIADSLRRRITEGEFAPGDLLPSGRDLCEQWSVSRATVNKAFDVLRADGVIVAHQGLGFRVTDTPLARPAGGRRSGATRAASGRPFRRLGRPAQAIPPARVAEVLALKPGETALHRDRLVLLADGAPLSLVSAWFPAEVAIQCPKLSQAQPIAEGTTHYVARQTGRSPVQGTDVTTVRLASAEEAEVLDRQLPLAVAVDLHIARDADGVPLVCEVGVTPSDLWERVENYGMGTVS
ncbi:GntR family transcriptional regulator [Streptomyces rectiverticillatus]|uniref:GntR family transcriptional regulator n=1 Tax=Streptomyces rectiverticillatus TaxID=173860 RepID=UPI0015C30D99|nr:GntR family transcriptional regulator [Streptomyces rectiverticillatus]QLE73478.1 GntR family transcriptional regulator [Streptomyces rectiverticillatus]